MSFKHESNMLSTWTPTAWAVDNKVGGESVHGRLLTRTDPDCVHSPWQAGLHVNMTVVIMPPTIYGKRK